MKKSYWLLKPEFCSSRQGFVIDFFQKRWQNFRQEKKGENYLYKNMNTILFWSLILVGFGLFVYFVPYKNIKIMQKLQREGLEKLDTIIELLNKKN